MIPIAVQEATKAEAFAMETFFDKTFIGDVLVGQQYLQPRLWDPSRLLNEPYIWLGMVANNPWTSLKRLGVQFDIFRGNVAYQCAYDEPGNTYYWMVPRVIMPMNWEAWKKRMNENHIPDYVQDYEFHRSMNFRDKEDKPDIHPGSLSIPGAMMGHGYTHGCNPYDGSRDRQAMIVKLSDGSDMICSCWVWYNK